jgi:hypothetical protein
MFVSVRTPLCYTFALSDSPKRGKKYKSMRLFFILLLLAALRASALAQGQPVQIWQAVEYVQMINIKGPVIALDRFQNTYMLTNQTDESPFSGFTLVKYDTLGNALWKRHSQISIIGALYGSFTVDSMGTTQNSPFNTKYSHFGGADKFRTAD